MSIASWILRLWDRHGPARRPIVIKSDSLPKKLPWRNLVLARDDGDDWSVGMRYPCGCGAKIELLVLPDAKPRWDVRVDDSARPTLHPSVWKQTGCRSHFWVRDGLIQWRD